MDDRTIMDALAVVLVLSVPVLICMILSVFYCHANRRG